MTSLFQIPLFIAALLILPGVALAAPTPQGINPDYPAVISNQNIWKIYSDYQLFIEEIDKSISKKNAGMLSHDATRWKAYIQALRNYVGYWQQHAFLDLPVTHGRDWELSGPLRPTCEFKDNTSACEMIALVITARDELALSASAELPMHLYPADLTRQEAIWAAIEGYVDFLITNSPMDEPVTAAEERLGLKPGFDAEPPAQ